MLKLTDEEYIKILDKFRKSDFESEEAEDEAYEILSHYFPNFLRVLTVENSKLTSKEIFELMKKLDKPIQL